MSANKTSDFEEAEFGKNTPRNQQEEDSDADDSVSQAKESSETARPTPPMSPDADEASQESASESSEASSIDSASTDVIASTRTRIQSTTEEAMETMPRRRFVQWLAGAAGIGVGAAVTGQSILHYLTRDPTLDELSLRVKTQKVNIRIVEFKLPSNLKIGENCFVCARPVGATAWDQINNIQNGVWGLAPNQFPSGGDIELTLGIMRNGEIAVLDKPSLGTIKGIEKAR